MEKIIEVCEDLLRSVSPLGHSEIGKNGEYLGGFRISGWRLDDLKSALKEVENVNNKKVY